jgi:hypothetical protein
MGGMELLARLRAQRTAGGPAPTAAGAAASPNAGASSNEEANAEEKPDETTAWAPPVPTNRNRTVSVDVCGGVDCAGE